MDVEGEQGDRWTFSGTSDCAMEITEVYASQSNAGPAGPAGPA